MSVHSSSTPVRAGTLLPLMALIAIWALMHTALVVFRDVPVFESGLIDPDSYMRLVRVSELAQSWQWFDNTIARANAPYGDVLHWTRPFDLLILLLALPVGFAVEAEQALYLAGMTISPLVQLVTALLLIWALRPVIRPEVWFLPAVALFVQPGALAYSTLGRADHHALLLLVFVVVAGFMLRALRDPFAARPAVCAGLAAGFGVWLSVEFLLVVGLCFAALGVPWLFGERERVAQNKWCALGVSIVLLLALFVERPLDNLLEASYDSISSVHYLLAVAALLFWRTVETLEARRGRASHFVGRASLGMVGVGAVVLLLVSVFPQFFAGPMAEVDPRIVPIWLDRVLEMRPLMPSNRHTFGTFLIYLGGIALVTPPLLGAVLAERGGRRFYAFLFIAMCCLLLTVVALRHIRFSSYAEIAFVFAFAVVLDRFLLWSGRFANDLVRGLLRGSFIGLVLMSPILVGSTLMTQNAVAGDKAGQFPTACSVREVATYLETDPAWRSPQTVLAFMDLGPELLYRTRHRVIGTPYHRNGDGIFDGHRILAATDEAAARALVEQRGIDLVLICRTPSERVFYAPGENGENLYVRLDRGTPPEWLATVELPPALQDQARLYRVLR